MCFYLKKKKKKKKKKKRNTTNADSRRHFVACQELLTDWLFETHPLFCPLQF